MSIDFQNKDYTDNIERWQMVDNICSGRDVDQYLLELNKLDTSPENAERNKQYKERAVFYAVAGYTLQGLIGLLFSKNATIELPLRLEYLLTNVDGAGTDLIQQAQDVSGGVIKKARSVLFVSFPKTESSVSLEDMKAGNIAATINQIDAEQVISYHTKIVGSRVVLASVVITEIVEVVEDHEIEEVDQIRELFLTAENVFNEQLWRKDDKSEWVEFEEVNVPTDSAGNVWNVIPLVFIGSQSNTTRMDESPIYPLARINLSHYRNSAEYEDSIFYVGQAQPWMSGVDQRHVDMMKTNNMYIGSRSLMGVPSGESFGFASADANPLVRQAMLDKLEMMIGLGARFIQESGVAKTATEDDNDDKKQNSTLSLISGNVSDAYVQALKWAAMYMGETTESVFELNKEFTSPKATAQELQAMVAGFIQGAIPLGDYFRWMKKVDLTDKEKTIEEFSEEVHVVDDSGTGESEQLTDDR